MVLFIGHPVAKLFVEGIGFSKERKKEKKGEGLWKLPPLMEIRLNNTRISK
jgi:hypothetical protein